MTQYVLQVYLQIYSEKINNKKKNHLKKYLFSEQFLNISLTKHIHEKIAHTTQ